MNTWGKHYMADCAGCSKILISDPEQIKIFVKDLVVRINMEAYGEPILEHFATHDPMKGGYTLCQMISTSLIDGHFVDATGEAYISIHSCKDFDEDAVKKTIQMYFRPSSIKEHIIFRQA